MTVSLRPYQSGCVYVIRDVFGRCRCVLFCLPTGGGKTVIFAYITLLAAAKGRRVIILANRQEIVDQISSALWQMGVPHGRIQPGYPTTHLPVQVAMVQTLVRRLDTIPEPQLLVIDEAHHAVAGTCVTVKHAEHVAHQFRDCGIPAASIDGTMRLDHRRGLVNALRAGAIRVLTSCDIISEGFDVPGVGGAILLRPTKSFVLYRQQVGRALRPKLDGSPATILDHAGNVSRHDLPDAPHEWSLHSKRRKDRSADQSKEPHRTCRACSGVFGAGMGIDMCPTPGVAGCLFPSARVPHEREGELQEVNPLAWADGLDLQDVRGTELRRLVEKADGDTAKLRQIQQAKSYKPGWVYYATLDAAHKRGGLP